MLGNIDASANLAVKDMNVARKFYEEKLGLTEAETEGEDFVVYRSGDTNLNVYRSKEAGTNKATAVTWMVDDVDAEVEELKSKGIEFEHYDMPGMTREGDIHVGGDMRVAWFKDPDGNILNLASR